MATVVVPVVIFAAASSFVTASLLKYGFEALHGSAPLAILLDEVYRSFWRLRTSRSVAAALALSAIPLATYVAAHYVKCGLAAAVVAVAAAYALCLALTVLLGAGPWYMYSALPATAATAALLLVGNYIASSVAGSGIHVGGYEGAYAAQLEAIKHYRSLWGALLNTAYVFGVLAAVSAAASSLAVLRQVYGDCALLESVMYAMFAAPLLDVACEVCALGLYVPVEVVASVSYVLYALKYLLLYSASYCASQFFVYCSRTRSLVNVAVPLALLALHVLLGVVGCWIRG